MKRGVKFVQSHKPYAVDLGSLTVREHNRPQPGAPPYYEGRVSAVWFRRRRNGHNGGPLRTVVCFGQLWDFQDARPGTADAFLLAHTDGRYGGDCQARWDGSELWAPGADEETRRGHLALLQPILAAYPALPAYWDGWWAFRE